MHQQAYINLSLYKILQNNGQMRSYLTDTVLIFLKEII